MAGKAAVRAQTWGGRIAVALVVLGLAACTGGQPSRGPVSAPLAPPAIDDGLAHNTFTPKAPKAAAAAPAPAAKSAKAPATPAAAANTARHSHRLPEPTTPEVAEAVPPPSLPGPDRLKGLSGGQVVALLGAPAFVRRDPPAEIWQYGTDTCVLDLFLYPKEKGGPHRVSHFEFRGRTVAGVAPADCYHQLLAAGPHSPAS